MHSSPKYCSLLALILAAVVGTSVHAQQVGDVFVIALENHNWTVSGNGYTGNAQTGAGSNLALKNDPAAPYLNSLVDGTSSISSQVAFAQAYYNAGSGEHPSEPNYIWAEAGTNFNPIATGTATSTTQGTITGNVIKNDNDPTAGNQNIFTGVPHLTAQMNSAGISWRNYQEDYQILNNSTPTGGSPTVSKSGTSTTVLNPYNNTHLYNYAVKHNPMAFFSDTQTQNIRTFDQLRSNISADAASLGAGAVNNFGRYNWITPDQYNDMHSDVGNYTYHGTTYSGDQSAVATGDNFLATIIPLIMATAAYQNNGAIIIWTDETEGGDSTAYAGLEMVISPLAHPNVAGLPFSSTLAMSHSSDLKTMEEIFQLGSVLNNAIPLSEAFATGGYASVQGANDLSSLFGAGVIPQAVPEPSPAGLFALGALLAMATIRRRQARC